MCPSFELKYQNYDILILASLNEFSYLRVGVLWLSVISEFTYIGLLGMGFLLMWLEVLCSHKEMHSLKINAYAAICTVLSGETLCIMQLNTSAYLSVTA